jgi:hypothetical protein
MSGSASGTAVWSTRIIALASVIATSTGTVELRVSAVLLTDG